jgi:hypothetical protein
LPTRADTRRPNTVEGMTIQATQLDDVGMLHGQPEFEAVFTGVVQSAADDARLRPRRSGRFVHREQTQRALIRVK